MSLLQLHVAVQTCRLRKCAVVIVIVLSKQHALQSRDFQFIFETLFTARCCLVQFSQAKKYRALSPDDEVPGPPVKDFMSLGH